MIEVRNLQYTNSPRYGASWSFELHGDLDSLGPITLKDFRWWPREQRVKPPMRNQGPRKPKKRLIETNNAVDEFVRHVLEPLTPNATPTTLRPLFNEYFKQDSRAFKFKFPAYFRETYFRVTGRSEAVEPGRNWPSDVLEMRVNALLDGSCKQDEQTFDLRTGVMTRSDWLYVRERLEEEHTKRKERGSIDLT